MRNRTIIINAIYLLFVVTVSCTTIQLPKFTTMEKLSQIKTGMIRDQVELILGIPAYQVSSIDENGDITVIYNYRVSERKVARNIIQPTNGLDTWGNFGRIFITFSKDERVVKAFACGVDCGNGTKSNLQEKKKSTF